MIQELEHNSSEACREKRSKRANMLFDMPDALLGAKESQPEADEILADVKRVSRQRSHGGLHGALPPGSSFKSFSPSLLWGLIGMNRCNLQDTSLAATAQPAS